VEAVAGGAFQARVWPDPMSNRPDPSPPRLHQAAGGVAAPEAMAACECWEVLAWCCNDALVIGVEAVPWCCVGDGRRGAVTSGR
jgi:hypothetical protein